MRRPGLLLATLLLAASALGCETGSEQPPPPVVEKAETCAKEADCDKRECACKEYVQGCFATLKYTPSCLVVSTKEPCENVPPGSNCKCSLDDQCSTPCQALCIMIGTR